MSETICNIARCDNPTDGYVCRGCIGKLETQLAEVPWLVDQLTIVRTQQTNYTNPFDAIATGGETPIPVNLKAGTLINRLSNELGTWCRVLAEPRPEWQLPRGTPSSTSAWLLRRLETIRNHPDAGPQIEALFALTAGARWLIFRRAARWYAGICSMDIDGVECPEDLYAEVAQGTVTCKRCGTHHDVARRREILLKAAENHLATASEAARAIVVWSDYQRGETRLVRRIGMWADRGRIEVRGHQLERGKQRPTYRIGDILDLIADDATRRDANAQRERAC